MLNILINICKLIWSSSRLNKATKNKNKKLLNILLKPVQQTAKTVKSDGHTLENLNDNEFDNSEDVDLTEVTGILLLFT